MPANYPKWVIGVTPSTHHEATATRTRVANGVLAIRVRGATYRGSQPLDGVFELVSRVPQQVAGEERFEVYCAWFGVKPFTKYPRISVLRGNYEVLTGYTGPVVDDISERIGEAAQTAVNDVPLPEEVTGSCLVEGAVRTLVINAYERNPEARRRCLEHYGRACSVCRMEFAAMYGPLAEGFIHVHHLKPLSEIGEEYEVDPVNDLRPICPNCHAVIHLGGQCRSIEEVRQQMKDQKPPI